MIDMGIFSAGRLGFSADYDDDPPRRRRGKQKRGLFSLEPAKRSASKKKRQRRTGSDRHE